MIRPVVLPIILVALLGLGGCVLFRRPVPQATPTLHEVVGAPYQEGGVWRYPRAEYGVDQTGLATIMADRYPAGFTADGEVFDQTALAAGHRTLQLPAVLIVTNLENGRQIRVRLNDRGPSQPGRLIALTRRAAQLLGIVRDATRVRIQMDDAATRQIAAELEGAAPPEIAVAAAPRGAIATESLTPPDGSAQSSRGRVAASRPVTADALTPVGTPVASRLPEQVTQTSPAPGQLYVSLGDFSRLDYASILANKLAYLGARLVTSYTAPRDKAYRLQIGPLPTVADAEAMMNRAIAAGVNDAAITVQ